MAGLQDISLGNNTFVYATDVIDYDTLIGSLQSVGDITRESNIVDVPVYGEEFQRKLVGSSTVGSIDVVTNTDPSDEGYVLLSAKAKTKERVNFKVEFQNASKTAGHFITFTGIVASNSMSSSFDETRSTTFSIAVDGATSELTPNEG